MVEFGLDGITERNSYGVGLRDHGYCGGKLLLSRTPGPLCEVVVLVGLTLCRCGIVGMNSGGVGPQDPWLVGVTLLCVSRF